MITVIGIVAGEIWHYLDNHNNTVTLDDLLKNLERERDVILMSIGWLAREGHVFLEGDNSGYKLTLRA